MAAVSLANRRAPEMLQPCLRDDVASFAHPFPASPPLASDAFQAASQTQREIERERENKPAEPLPVPGLEEEK